MQGFKSKLSAAKSKLLPLQRGRFQIKPKCAANMILKIDEMNVRRIGVYLIFRKALACVSILIRLTS